MSKTITLPLGEYEALEANANKFIQLKNIEAEIKRLTAVEEAAKKKLSDERDRLCTELSYLNAEATKLKEHLSSAQADMPVVLETHPWCEFMRIKRLVPFNKLKPYYENEPNFIRFVEDVEAKALKSKHSLMSFIFVCILSFFAGALLL